MSDRDLILAGKHLLIVDDEPLLAYDLADTLGGHGATIVGPHHSLDEAIDCVAREAGRIDCALLDIQLGEALVWPLAERLEAAGVPFFFISARCGLDPLPDQFRERPCLKKPVNHDQLRITLAGVLFRR